MRGAVETTLEWVQASNIRAASQIKTDEWQADKSAETAARCRSNEKQERLFVQSSSRSVHLRERLISVVLYGCRRSMKSLIFAMFFKSVVLQ